MGDFGRYILQPSLKDVESADPRALLRDAERAVFDRVLDLGWTPERFNALDSRRGLREDNPIERFGKKYQWIGFYEILGRITDNHDVSSSWDSTRPQPYQHPEQLIWRDIDPTALARSTAAPSARRPWFSPTEARFPEGIAADYPDDMTAIPDPLDLIAIRDPQETPWLTLASRPNWKQQIAPETEALGIPRREAWMHVDAYLIPVTGIPALQDWARGTITHWDTRRSGPMPEGLTLTTAGYAGTGTSRDASADAETTGWVPSRRLHDILLPLTHGTDFVWSDAYGTAIHDPSTTASGPATLAMRRDLLPRLTSAGLTLFWTVLIGNELHSTDPLSHPGSDYRWVSASASYLFSDDTITLISAAAARCAPGPETERNLTWTPRLTDH
jgi:hypothetical protein